MATATSTADLNECTLIGKIARSVKHKELDDGTPMSRFTVLTDEMVHDKNKLTYHDCVAWGKSSEDLENGDFDSGDRVKIKGRMNKRSYTSSSGQKVKVTEIVVSSIERLPKSR